mmetsp:Transcript_2231/g.4712  ORF Transcript_2231/g.4712 Transcript_2231/m.4712 type:complete len:169 (+) Transcript_2231:402-908(+)
MYIVQILGSDETTQKFGCVMIFYAGFASGETSFLNEPNIQNTVRKVISAFCLRVGAIHICFPNTPTYQFAAAGLSLLAPSIIRVRVRQHLGAFCVVSRACLESCKLSLFNILPVVAAHLDETSSANTICHLNILLRRLNPFVLRNPSRSFLLFLRLFLYSFSIRYGIQ